jgi:hypothetical protein
MIATRAARVEVDAIDPHSRGTQETPLNRQSIGVTLCSTTSASMRDV